MDTAKTLAIVATALLLAGCAGKPPGSYDTARNTDGILWKKVEVEDKLSVVFRRTKRELNRCHGYEIQSALYPEMGEADIDLFIRTILGRGYQGAFRMKATSDTSTSVLIGITDAAHAVDWRKRWAGYVRGESC